MSKNIGKNINKDLSDKYSQKLFGCAKQCVTDTLKTTLKRAIQKTAETTGDLIGNKIANTITKVSRSSSQNNSETITNERDKKLPKERYTDIYLYIQKKKKDSKAENYWWSKINIYWAKINDESRGTYNKDNQIRFKISMLRSSLCDYSDVYVLVKRTITVANTTAQGQVKSYNY